MELDCFYMCPAYFKKGMHWTPKRIAYQTLKWGPKAKQNLKFLPKLDDWRDHGL